MAEVERVMRTRDLPDGLTRDCTDPWIEVEIKASGEVRPCCARPPVGSLATETLAQILNGSVIKPLRGNLLSGKPDGECVECRLRPPTTKEQLEIKIRALIEQVAVPPNFDPALYLAANPDVARAGVDPVKHFLTCGRLEGRPLFPGSLS